jgi:hypothetical protein
LYHGKTKKKRPEDLQEKSIGQECLQGRLDLQGQGRLPGIEEKTQTKPPPLVSSIRANRDVMGALIRDRPSWAAWQALFYELRSIL